MTSWLSFVIFNCGFVTLPYGILGQVWYLIVSIPDCCHLSYFGIAKWHISALIAMAIRVQLNAKVNKQAILFDGVSLVH